PADQEINSGPSSGPDPLATDDSDKTAEPDYSKTNTQVKDIDEGDIIKTDGRYIYTLSRVWNDKGFTATLSIVQAKGAESLLLSQLVLSTESGTVVMPQAATDGGVTEQATDSKYLPQDNVNYQEMFIHGETIAVVSTHTKYRPESYTSDTETCVEFYDISDKANPRLVWTYAQSGWYEQARLVDGKLFVLTRFYVVDTPDPEDPATFVPLFRDGQQTIICPPGDICIMPEVKSVDYAVVGSIDVARRQQIDQLSVLGGADTMYMSMNNLYIASAIFDEQIGEPYRESVYTVTEHRYSTRTQITRVDIADGYLTATAQGIVDGELLNQFALDEYADNLRLAVTINDSAFQAYVDKDFGIEQYIWQDIPSTNAIYVLSPELEVLGSLANLAETERIYSVRFMGDIGYIVTFRQVDPLFAIDLSNPAEPQVLSALKIPGFSSYLHPWSNSLLFGLGQNASENGQVNNMKLSMFDISDPAAVQELDMLRIDSWYSEALYDHHAILIDPARNLIGFGGDSNNYLLFCYGSNGFTELADLSLGGSSEYAFNGSVRGLYIGNYLYVFTETSLYVFDLETYQQVQVIQLAEGGYSGIMPLMVE
ncbi:MAG: beta-propeller domain-containing protein, partial [Coriobacteriales bacterium]|nr:beta-propeller domain-containing protein [Coriobacteriales bacterium]